MHVGQAGSVSQAGIVQPAVMQADGARVLRCQAEI